MGRAGRETGRGEQTPADRATCVKAQEEAVHFRGKLLKYDRSGFDPSSACPGHLTPPRFVFLCGTQIIIPAS